MDLLILDGQASGYFKGNPAYRGTFRAHPHHADSFPEDHDLNRAFTWFIEEGDVSGVVHDVAKARNLVKLYRQYAGKDFEIVEATAAKNLPVVGQEFLGFDLSSGLSDSLLSWGLTFSSNDPAQGHEDLLDYLLLLIEGYFKPALNSNGLFDDYGKAQFCLRCMMALQTLRPGTFEGGADYEVIGLHVVPL